MPARPWQYVVLAVCRPWPGARRLAQISMTFDHHAVLQLAAPLPAGERSDRACAIRVSNCLGELALRPRQGSRLRAPAPPALALTRPARQFDRLGKWSAPSAPTRMGRLDHAAIAIEAGFQSCCLATIVLRMVSSLRRQAIRATFFNLPRLSSES